jgi:hypothetical protein
MTAFNQIARRAVLAAVAVAALAAAGSASAEVLMARSECIDGYWHVMTYDISDPDHWVLTEDRPTPQPCGPARPSLNVDFHIHPTFELRPMLRYHIEESEPRKEMHIPMRYKF